MKHFVYYDARGTFDTDYSLVSDHANGVWLYVAPEAVNYAAQKAAQAGALGLNIILNIQGLVWNTYTWELLPNALTNWMSMYNAFSAAGAWPYVKALYHADEPFWNAVCVSPAAPELAKTLMSEKLRVINSYLCQLAPDKERLVINSWLELHPGHAAYAPWEPNIWGHTIVGFAHYSEEDNQPFCDTPMSYATYLNYLRSHTDKPKVVVPDGVMFANDVMEEKLKRIEWICAFGVLSKDVVGIIPYCWSSSVRHTGVKENPLILDKYRYIANIVR